jgi:hypothetical protein
MFLMCGDAGCGTLLRFSDYPHRLLEKGDLITGRTEVWIGAPFAFCKYSIDCCFSAFNQITG